MTVEFALLLPVLLALVIGIAEFGWMTKQHLVIANAVRDGVRYAALGNPSTAVRTRVKNAATTLPTALTDSQIVLDQTSDTSSSNPTYYAWPADAGSPAKNAVPVGNMVRVSVTYPFKPLTGFFPFLKGRNINVSATMTREVS